MANSAAQFDTLGQTPVQLRAGSGTLFGYDVGNSDGSPAMVLFYDKATPPVFSTDTPFVRVLSFSRHERIPHVGCGDRVHGRALCSRQDIARDAAAQR
jgi:hypothetical protein